MFCAAWIPSWISVPIKMSAHVDTSVPVATSPVAASAVMTLPIECDLDSASRAADSSIGMGGLIGVGRIGAAAYGTNGRSEAYLLENVALKEANQNDHH